MDDHKMCINQEQYGKLRDTQKEVEISLASVDGKLDGVCVILERVEKAVYGNGTIGIRAEIELLKTKLGQKIDWKWIGMLLLQAVLLALIIVPDVVK